MSLDDILSEAKNAGLNSNEVETVKKQYFFGMLKYEERHPEPDFHRFGSAILGMIHYKNQSEYCGESYARKYIRETVTKTRKE